MAAASPWGVLRRELVVREPNEAEGCDLTTRSVWRRGSASVGWGGGNAHASGCVRGAGGRSGSVRAYILLSNLLHELRTRGEMQKMQRCDGHPVLSEKNHWKTAPARERKCSDCGGAQCVHAPTRGPIFPAKGYLLGFELIFLMLFVVTRTLVRQHF